MKPQIPSPDNGPTSGVPNPFDLLIPAVFLLVLAGVLVWLIFRSGGTEEKVERSDELLFERPPIETARAFAKALKPEERLKLSRNPKEIARHLSKYPVQAINEEVLSVRAMTLIHGRDFPFARFEARFAGEERRVICVVKTPEGDRVDWDAFARYGTAGWEEIFDGLTNEALVRVILKPSDYYNYRFGDDQRWACYELSSPDLDGKKLYGYVDRKSVAEKILSERFNFQGKKKIPIRVSLQIAIAPEDADKGMVEITKLFATSWVIGDRDFESHWSPSVK